MTSNPLFNRNMFFLTALSLLWAWQLLLSASFILCHFVPPSNLSSQVLPEWRYLLKPEWKPLIYHLVLAAALVSQAALLWINRGFLNTKDLLKHWRVYLVIETVLTFLWSAAAFKMVVYADRPVLAAGAFVILFVAAVLGKRFCGSWQGWADRFWHGIFYLKTNARFQGVLEWSVPAGLFILLFIPNIEGVVARNFIGEQFHHNDSFIMGPGWAYLSGQKLDVDIISQYGIGFVIMISRLAQFFGGYSYEHVVAVMVYGTLLYYLAWYFLIRRWLGSMLLAGAVMLLALKWQIFHRGAFPLVYTYGSQTPVRFIYDVVYFYCLWMHIKSENKIWLLGAAAACGFGIFYLTSEGLYGTASFMAYILLLWVLPAWRRHFRMRPWDGILILFPWVLAVFLLAILNGFCVLKPEFWGNIGEFISYFTSGFGLEPMYRNLLDHNYLDALMGFVLPMVYFLTLLVFLSRLAVNLSEKTEWFTVVLCLYGLGTFHYYVARSSGTNYDAVCLPFVFILGSWARIIINALKENQRTAVQMALFAVAAWALVTTHLFLSYPNMINLSANPLTDPKVALPLPSGGPYFNHLFRNFEPELKLSVNSLGGTQEEILAESDFKDDDALVAYYRQNSRFTRDANLIASLTAHSDEVPLISGFEVEMLMQAKRKPFFYYFPLLITRPMTMRCFEACSIYTSDQLVKTIKKFEDVKPPYVFMERIYMVNEVPQAYLFRFPSLIPLINYVRAHYTPVAQGEFLVALKRKQ